ncbi:peptide deformylase [Stackebrandtia albiflava]|uniref:Peptide deformylase n=1 Tax=Stackebrandtia albiflava TaxID=406432 RepID=A0A562V2L9_9ACTN|nr:peptide deformylase [Stackebrandtia albiflava]TWJ12083.1 peptide deformylase [Stackebrandtia albiflava]
MSYDRTYVSKVASGVERGSREFARRADDAMHAGGELLRAWNDQHPADPPQRRPAPAVSDPAGALVVDHDHAELFYDAGVYRLTQRRRLVNHGAAPVTRYLIRIAVDRYPGRPERSNRHYCAHPLTWDEIDLHAWHGEGRAEAMPWTVQHDRDAFKEVWLRFENAAGQRFPLYPGSACWIEYTYTVGDDKWGNWFRRAVRHPTNHLAVTLDFPTEVDPAAWGLHTSMAGDDMPLATAIQIHEFNGRRVFSWATDDPPLHARYKMEWTFRNGRVDAPAPRPSQVMASLGVIQDGDPLLRRTAQPFDLPAEADATTRVVDDLRQAADRISKAHTFGKGMGIAAPQIGIDRAAAIAYPPGDPNPIVLLNPRIVETSDATDSQYEGCLSSFDVRCRIPRPLQIHVEHQERDGQRRITIFEKAVARLVAHEVDHLHGVLCADHLPDGEKPIPVEQYRGTGTTWQYPA